MAPDSIMIPIVAAVWRAVLGGADFSIHLAGPTAAGKSEIAALAQRHFGLGMDARNLPGSWSSTANALEGLAFAAKDVLLVVDDFAPAGAQHDAERAHREADRILRAQGNRSGRLRMRADGSLRAARPPRGLILSTGEDIPRGQSLRARMLVLEVGPRDVDWKGLTACQATAAEGATARAMSGFLRFVAGRYDEIRQEVAAWVPQLREAAARSGAHRRTPEIVAHLATGFGVFLRFARTAGVTDLECEQLWRRTWTALGEAADGQTHHQAGAEPAKRFLELFRGAIASGRAHLANPKGDHPEEEGAWGWRRNDFGTYEPKGERVGWLDDDNVYLEPEAAYAVVQRLGHEIGDRLSLTPQTLRKRLNERGMLLSTGGSSRPTLTVRRTLEGQRRDVLHLDAATLSSPAEKVDQLDHAGDEGPSAIGLWPSFSASWSSLAKSSKGDLAMENGHLPGVSASLDKLVQFSTRDTPSREGEKPPEVPTAKWARP